MAALDAGYAVNGVDAAGASKPSVALVHDYLNQCGGAERVVLSMSDMWPDAPIYTSLYRPESTYEAFRSRDIRTSWLNRVPVDDHFRMLLPLYPAAMRGLGELDADVVISSSSGWAHGVRVAPDSTHIVYCHTPARWLYCGDDYMRVRIPHSFALKPLKQWDRQAARRPGHYIANARTVARRIRDAYGIEAAVIHPPVDTLRFTPRPRGERLLVVSRLMRYKRIDLIVEAAARLGMGLDVVGIGPERERLEALAGPRAVFHGRVDDGTVLELMERCWALCVSGDEDFGIAPVEANAAGKPVVAFAAGGVLESMREGVTATFFARQDVDDVVAAIKAADDIDTSPEDLAANADRFSEAQFAKRLEGFIEEAQRSRV